MTPTLYRFEYDHWELVSVSVLQEGDLISHNGMQAIVRAPSVAQANGQWIINAGALPDEGPIVVELQEADTPLLRVMDMLLASRQVFNDGTSMLLDDGCHPPSIYSPRLPLAELEAFCLEHQDKYEVFARDHAEELSNGEPVRLEPWWPFRMAAQGDAR